MPEEIQPELEVRMRVARHAVVACLFLITVSVTKADEGPQRSNGPMVNDSCRLTLGGSVRQWAVGDSGRVLNVVNGDTSAQYNLGYGQYDLNGVSFADPSHGWIVGSKREEPNQGSGVVFSTKRGGSAAKDWVWSCPVVRPDVNVPFLKVQAMDVRHVWVTCGDGYMLWTSDGGACWLVTARCNRTGAERSDHER